MQGSDSRCNKQRLYTEASSRPERLTEPCYRCREALLSIALAATAQLADVGSTLQSKGRTSLVQSQCTCRWLTVSRRCLAGTAKGGGGVLVSCDWLLRVVLALSQVVSRLSCVV